MSAAPYRFKCLLPNGLHARPASMIAAALGPFESRVTIAKLPAGSPADARSVLSVVGLDVRMGDSCEVRARGTDAPGALAAFCECVERLMTHGEAPLALPDEREGGRVSLPRGLADAGVPFVAGRGVSGGVGLGVAVCVSALALSDEAKRAKPGPATDELKAAIGALAWVRQDLEHRASQVTFKLERELLHAHAQIAADPALLDAIEHAVRAGRTAAQSVVVAAERLSEPLRDAASAYIRDRALDVQDVCTQVLDRLTGGRLEAMNVMLETDSVVFADVLTANQLLRMDPTRLRALVLGHIGVTSHTVILARSMRIPTLIGVPDAGSAANPGRDVAVHGDDGYVVTRITPPVRRFFDRQRRTLERWEARLAPAAALPAATFDGVRLEVGINASMEHEVSAAVANGAEGVGLLRTELLFLDRATQPSEDEQFQVYAKVVTAAAGRPVIIRTFDIGGDKPAAYLPMPGEDNPFLGVRGLRLYERFPAMIRTQLRAILRASALGPVKIMAPMVAIPPEAAWFREQVGAALAELSAAGIAHDPKTPIGVMVEVPALALAMHQLGNEVDFVSIGTNDLCQYFMAVDRGNAGVAALYTPHQPAFLRLLGLIVNGAKASGTWVGVCGEMASARENLPLLIGLGVDEISVAPGDVLPLKLAIRTMTATDCRELLVAAQACGSAAEVRALLRIGPPERGRTTRLLDPDVISVGSDAASKAEAIREAIDLLFIAGRTRDVRAVEDAVWAREDTYSTGLGHGFAVPHCKTDAVTTPTLAVVCLATPIEWGSMDGLPVNIVLLLAMPAADATGGGAAGHMKIFAKLARKLMHDEFREKLGAATGREAIATLLREELGIE